jgi:hypothetical protein
MTDATTAALNGLRDLSMVKWYAIPLLSLVFYIYTREMKEAHQTGNWDAVLAGLTVFGIDFFNETWNSWVMVLTGRSAFWTTPGDTALRIFVGWNLEIIFMFLILGIIYYHSLTGKPGLKILGLPEKWFWAVSFSATCVFIECLLNMGNHLVWEYSFWNLSFGGVWLIFLIGYFHFFCGAILVITRKTMKAKVGIVAAIYAVAIVMNVIGLGVLGWKY